MTPGEWQRVFALVRTSQEQGEGQFTSLFEGPCGDDEEIREAAKSLLAAEQEMGSFLEPSDGPSSPDSQETRSDLQPLPRGAMLGRYVVLNMLAAGGMGVVYAAFDPRLNRKLAIKLLHPDAAGSFRGDDAKARLIREAQAMARLSHPNVIAVHDVGMLRGEVFIAMEYVDGWTLKQWLDAEHRGWREIVDMFLQAGRGLSAAHSAGIVHRDFKPDNVLVGKDGIARVLDFGLARGTLGAKQAQDTELIHNGCEKAAAAIFPPDFSTTGPLIGTPAYMAPEQIAGALVDARTDQFSFCAALYRALYGEFPFGGDTLAEQLAAVREGRFTCARASAKVPRWLRDVVLKGLHSDPEARYPSMDVLMQKLRHGPTNSNRRIAMAAIGVLAFIIPFVSYRLIAYRQTVPCRGANVLSWLRGCADPPALVAPMKRPESTPPSNLVTRNVLRSSQAASGLNEAPKNDHQALALSKRAPTRRSRSTQRVAPKRLSPHLRIIEIE